VNSLAMASALLLAAALTWSAHGQNTTSLQVQVTVTVDNVVSIAWIDGTITLTEVMVTNVPPGTTTQFSSAPLTGKATPELYKVKNVGIQAVQVTATCAATGLTFASHSGPLTVQDGADCWGYDCALGLVASSFSMGMPQAAEADFTLTVYSPIAYTHNQSGKITFTLTAAAAAQ